MIVALPIICLIMGLLLGWVLGRSHAISDHPAPNPDASESAREEERRKIRACDAITEFMDAFYYDAYRSLKNEGLLTLDGLKKYPERFANLDVRLYVDGQLFEIYKYVADIEGIRVSEQYAEDAYFLWKDISYVSFTYRRAQLLSLDDEIKRLLTPKQEKDKVDQMSLREERYRDALGDTEEDTK